MLTILGIDPGSRITGYGIIQLVDNSMSYVASGCLKLQQDNLPDKLVSIYRDIEKVVSLYSVQEVAVESVFMHQNPGAALKLGQARGAAIVGAATGNAVVYEYTAKQVKQSVVGYGAAAKAQVQNMVMQILKLSGTISEDSADALAVAICHANSRKSRNKLGEYGSYKSGRIK